jgi:hypothetical protein
MGAIVVARRITDRLHRFERVREGPSGMGAQRHGRRSGRNERNGADGCGELLLSWVRPRTGLVARWHPARGRHARTRTP